jgi:hypothetical protein
MLMAVAVAAASGQQAEADSNFRPARPDLRGKQPTNSIAMYSPMEPKFARETANEFYRHVFANGTYDMVRCHRLHRR